MASGKRGGERAGGDNPVPDEGFEAPSSGRYHHTTDLGILIQMIGDLKNDVGSLKSQVSNLERITGGIEKDAQWLTRRIWFLYGAATMVAAVFSVALWLFSDRLNDLRTALLTREPLAASRPADSGPKSN